MSNIFLTVSVALRKTFEPLTRAIFMPKKWQEQEYVDPNFTWEKAKEMNIDTFAKNIKKLTWKSDKHSGLFDFSPSEKNIDFVFKKRDNYRDCDDFSRLWFTFAKNKNYESVEYLIREKGKFFSSLHMICLFNDGHKWRYCSNNRISTSLYSTAEECLTTEAKRLDKYKNVMFKKYKKVP